MKKLFTSLITALLLAALLCPLALMEEEIAPEPVDAPVEVSDSVELTDEYGGELLESQAVLLESENLAEGGTHTGAFKIIVEGGSQGGATPMVGGVRAESADANTTISLRYDGGTIGATVTFDGGSIDLPDGSNGTIVEFTMPAKDVTIQLRFSESQGGTGGTGVSGDIPIDETHFPDAAFREYVIDNFDTEKDGYLSDRMRQSVISIGGLYVSDQAASKSPVLFPCFSSSNRSGALYTDDGNGAYVGKGITSLQGIEYFPNLRYLDCSYNPIASLDISMLSNLESLGCHDCGMATLNVKGCTKLMGLHLYNNNLTEVDISGCIEFSEYPKHYQISYHKNAQRMGFANKSKAKYIDCSRINTSKDIFFDAHTKVIFPNGSLGGSGSSSAPAVPASFTNTSEGVTVAVDPTSTASNTKAAVVATPGTVTQLDLSGATGKKFKSSNKKVATVNGAGVVTFKGPGKVKITYKVGKKTRKVTLTVTDPTFPSTIALNLIGTVPAKVGEPQTLVATLNDGAVSGIKWKSNKKKIATVNNGVVTFKKAGTVTITATTTRGKKKASVTFNVAK